MTRFILTIFIFFINLTCFCQLADTSYILTDSINGNKFHIQNKQILLKVKAPLSKYGDKLLVLGISMNGDTLYKSISISERHGCIAETIMEYREIHETTGAYRTINFIRPKKYIVKKYDKKGKLISKKKTDYLDPFIWGFEQFK